MSFIGFRLIDISKEPENDIELEPPKNTHVARQGSEAAAEGKSGIGDINPAPS